MIYLSQKVYLQLFPLIAKQPSSTMACGLLFGAEKGAVTHLAPIRNAASNPQSDWRMDIHQFAAALDQMIKQGLHLQAIYYTSQAGGQLAERVVRRWRHNVPCVVVSQTPTGRLELQAYAIDCVFKKA